MADGDSPGEVEVILVQCLWCHKTHAAKPGDEPCAPGAWIEDATGNRFEVGERIRAEMSADA